MGRVGWREGRRGERRESAIANARCCVFREYRYHWNLGGGVCGVFGVQAEESGGWSHGGDEEVLGVPRWVSLGAEGRRGKGGWVVVCGQAAFDGMDGLGVVVGYVLFVIV